MRRDGRPTAAYTWHVAAGRVLLVVDLDRDGWRSITNDAAGVVADLAELQPDLLARVPLIAYPRHGSYSGDAAVLGLVTVATRFGPFQTSTAECLPSHTRAAAMAASSVSASHAPELITSFALSSMSRL